MICRLTHIVTEATHEEEVRQLSLLLAVLPRDRVEQRVVVVGREPPVLVVPGGVEVKRLGRRLIWPTAWGADQYRLFGPERCDLVYAWGPAAAGGILGRCERPVLIATCDPGQAEQCSRWWRSPDDSADRGSVICLSRLVQRRLVETGVPMETTTVIRPGVDFGAIRQAKETVQRADLGLPVEGRVLLTASPPSRVGGQYHAMWAAAMLRQIWPDVKLIIPGRSKEQRRLRRFLGEIYCPEVYVLTEDRHTPAELLAVSDMLVVPPAGDVPTGGLAWAMAASVPILGSPVPPVTELIADGHNGFLSKSGEPHALAIRIRQALASGDKLRQCVETARGEAFEAFRTQRCVDEHLGLIDRVLAARG